MSGKKWRNSRSRFVQLPYRLLKSAAWHRLTPLERCAYIEIAQVFDGKNNGHLAVSARLLASLIPCSLNSAYQSLRALEDAGFVDTVKLGKYARKDEERLASEYRLTEFRCDATGEPPSRRYNPQLCWDRSAPKPKRKALSSAERVRRYRKRCNACNDDRSSYENGIVPSIRTVNVTPFLKRSGPPRKTAKNGERESADVTTIVPHIETHIHLTRGREIVGTPLRAKTGEKHTFGPSLAPGHSNCPVPKTNSLPPSWHWCKHERSVVTETGVQVPVVEHELVGTEEGRAALLVLRKWEHQHRNRRAAA